MNRIITNLINNLFHVIWLYALTIEPKYSKKKTIAISAAAMTMYEILCIAGFVWDGARTKELFMLGYFVGIIILVTTYACFLNTGSKQKSGFFFSAYIAMYIFIYSFAESFSDAFFGGAAWAVWAARIALNIGCLIIYERKIKKYFTAVNDDLKHSWGIMLMVSLLISLLLTMFLIYMYIYDAKGIFPIMFMFCALVLSAAVYIMLFRFIGQQQRYLHAVVMERQNLLLSERVKNHELSEEATRIAYHNLRHHNLIISEYARNGDCRAIIDYLGEHEAAADNRIKKKICENKTVNTIVSAYIKKAAQKDVELTANIKLAGVVAVNDIDMVSILANILDNAINGCIKAKDSKKIWLTIKEKDSKLIIGCKNSCANDIRFENGLPKNTQRRGIGITSIVKTAQKYSGVTDFSAKDGVFTCAVILKPTIPNFQGGGKKQHF